MIVMGSCFRALSGLRILKNTGTIWLVDSSALIYFSAKCPSTNATEKYNQYVLLEEINFCCYLSLQFCFGRHE